MTKKDLELILKVLDKIKNPDTYVIECQHIIKRNIEIYNQRKGQLREMHDYEYPW